MPIVRRLPFVIAVVVLAAGPARAQDPSPDVVAATQFDPATCKRRRVAPASAAAAPIPVTWKDYEITGTFLDSPATVRALLGPTLARHHALTEDAREQITAMAEAFGYHVVGLGTRDTPTGTIATLAIAPLPIVRRIDLAVHQSLWEPLMKDEVQRRLRVRAGSYLPWLPDERNCRLYEEKRRLDEFLHDEGYFEAEVVVGESLDGAEVTIDVDVTLGPAYVTAIDRIYIADADRLPIDADEIRDKFRHKGTCLFGLCFGSPRFTRERYEKDKQEVIDLFRRRDYPAVSVRVSDPLPDRQTKTVEFAVTIDPRRKVDVRFEGEVAASTGALRQQLTFDEAASFDDLEKNQSARAIADYLQSRGYFDARVTWFTPPTPGDEIYQPLVFQIHQGPSRAVREVQFVGNRAFGAAELAGAVATKAARLSESLLGTETYATSAQLAADVDRLVALYRRRGYRDVRVRVSASTQPIGLGSAALTAALIGADRGSDLYVRFTIDEGKPTVLSQVRVDLGDHGDQITSEDDRALCRDVLKILADLHGDAHFARPLAADRCVAGATTVEYHEDDAAATRDQLKDRLFARGRPRSDVGYEVVTLGPHAVAAVYRLRDTQQLRVGKIVIRGNFKTRDAIILGRLKIKPGQLLTSDALAESTRQLRNTGLFDSVNIQLPELATASAGAVNAVVEVTERYDYFTVLNFETGLSSYNGLFLKVGPSFKNLLGRGISLDVAVTGGLEAGELIDRALTVRQASLDATLRLPRYLLYDVVDGELTGFYRQQDTPRFGPLTTTGFTAGVSRTSSRPRTRSHPARARTIGLHYDFRRRERNVDVLRPLGADDDDSQVPITTRTGSIGITGEWEQRVDRAGGLSPLAPEGGFRLEGSVSWADPIFYGQDSFVKLGAAGSHYWSIGKNLLVRADIRYDHGIPLGGAALLPDVERFFGGGDATVRGYEEDRLATEIVQVGVPPLDNVSQIRVLPAGGNIRLLGSLDAQIRIYKLLQTALFVDAGLITNQWSTVTADDLKPSIGMALVRVVTPFGAFAIERAVPLRPQLGDDPRGRWHISFAARAQF